MSNAVDITLNTLTAQQFTTLRTAVGWALVEANQAEAGIRGSTCFSALLGGQTVGMAPAAAPLGPPLGTHRGPRGASGSAVLPSAKPASA